MEVHGQRRAFGKYEGFLVNVTHKCLWVLNHLAAKVLQQAMVGGTEAGVLEVKLGCTGLLALGLLFGYLSSVSWLLLQAIELT